MNNTKTLPKQNPEVSALADSLREKIKNLPDSSFQADHYYYVSADGNDENDGRTPETAWRSLVKVELMHDVYKPGTVILFERGGTYRGWFTLSNDCYYGAYGTGDKPRLIASLFNYADPSFWQKNENDLWVCNVRDFLDQPMSDIGQINCDEGKVVGFKKASLSEVHDEFDYYYDLPTGDLYFKHTGNPALAYSEIELCPKFHVISGYGVRDIVIENLDIRYSGAHGIAMGSNVRNISIRGCEIGWIGGSYLSDTVRFGNAVELWENGVNFSVEYCYLYECYDTALTHQGQMGCHDNIRFCNNLIDNCCYGIEFFIREGADSMMKNVLYQGNIIRNVGYGWGDQRPNPEANSAICGWWYDNFSQNFVIEDNIFENSDWYLVYYGNPYATGADVVFRNNSYYQDFCGKDCQTVYWDRNQPYTAADKEAFVSQIRLVDHSPKTIRCFKDGKELL